MVFLRCRRGPKCRATVPDWGPDTGVLCVDTQTLLRRHLPAIRKVALYLGFRDVDYQKLVLPSLLAYASYVHLLPASEAHHHSYLGGLLTHTLEVAHFGLQAVQGLYILEGAKNPSHRRRLDQRWSMAVFIAALAHDLGKPFTDIEVYTAAEKHPWNPCHESLVAWFTRLRLERYHYRWNSARLGDHERGGLIALNYILPATLKDWLMTEGPVIYTSVLGFLAGDSSEHILSPVLLAADQRSVAKSLQSAGRHAAPGDTGASKEQLREAMNALIQGGSLGLNTPGARFWVDRTHTAWLIWPAALDSVIKAFREAKVYSVNLDLRPEAIARLLIDSGLAQSGTASASTWEIRPAILPSGTVLRALRLADGFTPPALTDDRLAVVHLVQAPPVHTVGPPTTAAPGLAPNPPTPAPSAAIGNPANQPADSESTQAIRRATEWFHRTRDPTSEYLLMLATQLLRRLRSWGNTVVLEDRRVWLRWPHAFEGANPTARLNRLIELEWAEPAPVHSVVRVQKAPGGIDAVPLTRSVSQHFLAAAGGAPGDATPTAVHEPTLRASAEAPVQADAKRANKEPAGPLDAHAYAQELALALTNFAERGDLTLRLPSSMVRDYCARARTAHTYADILKCLTAAGARLDRTANQLLVPLKLLDDSHDSD